MNKFALAALPLLISATMAVAQTPKEIAIEGLTAVFIEPNPERVKELFSPNYIQHNPAFPNGPEALIGMASDPMPDLSYEIGNVIAEGNMVAVHFRVTGFGPKPMVGVDILRIEDGLIVEHWDVLQEEVTDTVSGNPMFTPAIK
jgi:predicted SnoaL-like aldol condensation-catalyzing enzyme